MSKNIFLSILVIASTFTFYGCTSTSSNQLQTNDAQMHRDLPNGTTKKGVSVSRYNQRDKQSGDKINALDVSWYYNWSVKPANDYIDGEFVPMIWGKNDVTDENLSYIKAQYENGKFSHLLTFNEPDLSGNDGLSANMTVDEALNKWESLESIGIPLSSPAVSYYDAENGNLWLDTFMEKAEENQYRVDFIALHIYQSFYSDGVVEDLKETLEALYDKYQLPIWLTEFGAIDIIARDSHANKVSASCTQKNTNSYIVEVTNMLEQLGFVERYSWFVDNFNQTGNARPWEAPYTTLYNDDDTISESGKTYRDVASVYPLEIDNYDLKDCLINKNYQEQILVRGGTGNYTLTSKGLPIGLKMSKNGTISGQATKKGIYPIEVTITDSGTGNRKQTLETKFILTVK